MLINKLEIKNFRQFYGKQSLKFSTDKDKNVTLIHAENGVGKTALLNSILWCLYELTTDNFELKTDLLNNHARNIGERTFHVHLEFTDNGKQYNVQRSSGFGGAEGSVFKVFQILESGDYQSMPDPELFVNSVIPKDMAKYFFFQGEGVGSLARGSKTDIRNAIRDILGFSVAEQAIADIGKVKSEYRREMLHTDKSTEFGKYQEDLANCEDKIRSLDVDLANCEQNRKNLVIAIDEINDYLRNSDSSVVKQRQKERETKTGQLDQLKDSLQNAKVRKTFLVAEFAISSFSFSAVNAGIEFIDESELKGRIPSPYNEQLVKDILEEGQCICGSDISVSTEAYGRINALLETAADPILLNRVTRARSQLTVVKRDHTTANEKFKNCIKEISELNQVIAQTKNELDAISLDIKDVAIEEIGLKENKLGQLKAQLHEINKSEGALAERIKNYRVEKDKLDSAISRIKSTEPATAKLKKLVDFSEKVEVQLKSVLKSSEDDSVRVLAQKINLFLECYVRQDYKVRISKDYEINLIDRENRTVGKSDGQSLLLSLTFISSLIALAKVRKNASGYILTPGTVAPFVIDAPFGVLDNAYKANIANELPKSVNQVILLLSSSHWEGSVEDAIRTRVGREYNMVLEVADSGDTKVKSHIEVMSNKYETARYGCGIDMTKIEEVGNYV